VERDAGIARCRLKTIAQCMRAALQRAVEAWARIRSSVARPAAIATGLPLSVPAW